jgi:hypothetical protein
MDYSDYYSDFPAPYNEEVPRRIAEVREKLSPIGEEVLEDLIAEGIEGTYDPAGEMILAMRISGIPEPEGDAIWGLLPLLGDAHGAAADAAEKVRSEPVQTGQDRQGRHDRKGKKMGKTNDDIGNGHGKLQGADAPAQLACAVPADEVPSETLTRFESLAEDLGHEVIRISYEGDEWSDDPPEFAVEGTVAQMGALLDAVSADDAFSDEASNEGGELYLYCGPKPNDGVPGVVDSAKPNEYENAALDAIKERHRFTYILPYRGPC